MKEELISFKLDWKQVERNEYLFSLVKIAKQHSIDAWLDNNNGITLKMPLIGTPTIYEFIHVSSVIELKDALGYF